MVDEFNSLFSKLNHHNSVLLTYDEIEQGFQLGIKMPLSQNGYAIAIEKNERYIIIELVLKQGDLVNVFHHDCREETKIITGKLKETVLKKEYESFEKMTIRRDIPHGILCIKDSLSYSKLWNPKYENS